MSDDNHAVHRDAFNLLCGKMIGRGMTRTVFDSPLLPGCVIKVEDGAGDFQNVIEWETWQRVKGTKFSRWFAECKWISPNGSVLVMERTRPAAPKEFPERMPVFLTDFKRTNYGMSPTFKDGKPGKEWFVCHDYGTHMLFEEGMSARLKRADWWDA